MIRRIGIVFLMALLLAACAPRGVDEACCVVAEADSLWQAGQTYDDSLRLAQAYETLSSFCSPLLSTLHPKHSTDYAHACYHYGRLLRRADDPVAAMQVFISGTHSGTDDHHILGRIYSNMGDLCHMAKDFQQSYDMYELSANYFMQNGDTLLYYYGLNNMAFELAEQGKKDESLQILDDIESSTKESNIINIILETKSEAYFQNQQYDSAIFYSNQAIAHCTESTIPLLIIAQSYSFLEKKDSATHYASMVVSRTSSLFDLNNALYILTQDDATKDINGVKQVSADRSDVQKLLEIRQGHLSKATQLLEQDLNYKISYWWYIGGSLLVVFIGIILWRYYTHKYRMQLRLQAHANHLTEKQADSIVSNINQHIKINDIEHTLHWKKYAEMKADADLYMGGIVSKLESIKLNETEIRFCILTMLDFPLKKIADTINYSPSGIKTLKKRISIKLSTTPQNLRNFLFSMAVSV